MNNWVLGTDTSHWSGDIDFNKMYNAGAKYWVTKASDANKVTGYQFEDIRFNDYCVQAFSHGKLLTGCYHWLQASLDPKVAADFYLERYNRYDFDFAPIMDFEETSVRDTGKFSDYAWRAQVWLDYVADKTGRLPIVYTAQWFTNYFKTEHISWMNKYPLWIANYSSWANNVAKQPVSYPKMEFEDRAWDDWTIWQFSADGNGRGNEFGVDAGNIDLNYFQGDYEDLLVWLGKEPGEKSPIVKPVWKPRSVIDRVVRRLR